jgi:uncharacterized protein (DUF1330 family)
MTTNFKIALAVVAGAAMGAAAMQGLYAQAKPKAYSVADIEVLDPAALDVYFPVIVAAVKDAGGRGFNTAGGRTIAFTGEAPKRVAIIEWDSLEQAQAFFGSAAFRNLAPQRDKAIRFLRAYAVEATSN